MKKKSRLKQNNRKRMYILLFLLLFTGIGYAFISTNLGITGLGNFRANSWDISFTSVTEKSGNVAALSPEEISQDGKSINFSVNFKQPGDTYVFYADIENSGTIPAMLNTIEIEDLSEEAEQYLESTITYADGIEVNQYDLLDVGETDTIKVVVRFKTDVDPEDLPEDGDDLDFALTANYVVIDENAKERTYGITTNPTVSYDDETTENEPALGEEQDWVTTASVTFDVADAEQLKSVKYCISSTDCTPNLDATVENGEFSYTFSDSATSQKVCLKATNIFGKTTTSCSGSYLVDGGSPTITDVTATANNSNRNIAVTVEATDSASGIFKYYYSKNGGTTYVSSSNSNYTFTTLSAGVYDIKVYVEDEAGNISEVSTTTAEIMDYTNYFAELVEDNALSDSSIDFSSISSASNGRGLYVLNGTENDAYPIYYYRGNVTNNNAKFAGFCWKIVRTTETGGTKLLYNGLPDGNGKCTNTTGMSTMLSSQSKFNTNENSPAYSGYMYGNVYEYKNDKNTNGQYMYGSSFNFADNDPNVSGDGTYTLTDTVTNSVMYSSTISYYRYTCFNVEGTCSELYYIYYLNGTNAYYISLKDGKGVNNALNEMYSSTTNSNIKTAVDNWFNNTFKTYFTNNHLNYNNYLEDTIWCNDRSMNTIQLSDSLDYVKNGWYINNGYLINFLYYSSYGRLKSGAPRVSCQNKSNSYTVVESTTGNGALTYPVGLLTTDEVILAGGQNADNSDFYLNNNSYWWTMSPSYYDRDSASVYTVYSTGNVNANYLYGEYGVRPSISIKYGVQIASGGDGTIDAPYEFVLE